MENWTQGSNGRIEARVFDFAEEDGAYGRLLAWRSIGALAGTAHDATAAEVAKRAQECSWYRIDADSPWFEQVAWDIGLAALDPRRSRLAVLAATDTD